MHELLGSFCIVNDSFDLPSMTDNAFIIQKSLNISFIKISHHIEVEA